MRIPPPNLNDSSTRPPRLRPVLNLGTLNNLPTFSSGPRVDDADCYAAIREAGYEAVQGGDPVRAHDAGLDYFTSGRYNSPDEADERIRRWKDSGALAATVHLAWGLEDDDFMDRLACATLDASARHGLPVYIETHRATITQDIYRTVKLVERIPEVRFNGDLSHWYTGAEMPYGDFDAKLDFCQPVFERVRFMHGRIGNPSTMQLDLTAGKGASIEHFRVMWRRCMRGFLASAAPGDYLPFAPELLPASNHYARLVASPDGGFVEDSDRWTQAGKLVELARQCFHEAAASA